MKKVLFITAILITAGSVVYSQEIKNTTYNFTLTAEDLQIIGKALDERPFKEVAPLLQKLNTQIQNQTANKEKEQTTPSPSPTAK